MGVQELIERIDQMSPQYREQILERIDNLILKFEKHMNDDGLESRAGRYIDVMNEIVGYDITSHSRLEDVFNARLVIIDRLTQEGISQVRIGNMIKRNHSTICYLRKLIEDAEKYPKQFPMFHRLKKLFEAKI